jgi:hypothetical protein
VALLESPPRRRRPLWAFAALLVVVAAGGWLLGEHTQREKPARDTVAAESPVPRAPAVATASAAALGVELPHLAGDVSVASVPAAEAAALAPRDKPKPGGARRAGTGRASARVSSAPATVAARPAAAVTGAWDPASFGPRR